METMSNGEVEAVLNEAIAMIAKRLNVHVETALLTVTIKTTDGRLFGSSAVDSGKVEMLSMVLSASRHQQATDKLVENIDAAYARLGAVPAGGFLHVLKASREVMPPPENSVTIDKSRQ